MESKLTESKIQRERSVSYPNFSLSDTVNSISELRKTRGKGLYSRLDAALGLGYTSLSGPAATKISTLVQFGLLSKEGINAYAQTQLAERITHPISDDDRNKAINESIYLPKLYKNLIEEYTGRGLPTQLGNILVRKGVTPKVSERVAENFRKDLEFAGLLKNGVVTATPDFTTKEPELPPFNDFASHSQDISAKNQKQVSASSESGKGWSSLIKSEKPLTTEIRKKIIEVIELLEKENKEQE